MLKNFKNIYFHEALLVATSEVDLARIIGAFRMEVLYKTNLND